MAKKTITLEVIDGEVTIHGFDRNAPEYRYSTLDETIKELLDVQSTDTKLFEAKWGEFNQAIDDRNSNLAKQFAEELKTGLHPTSSIKKIIDLDMCGLE